MRDLSALEWDGEGRAEGEGEEQEKSLRPSTHTHVHAHMRSSALSQHFFHPFTLTDTKSSQQQHHDDDVHTYRKRKRKRKKTYINKAGRQTDIHKHIMKASNLPQTYTFHKEARANTHFTHRTCTFALSCIGKMPSFSLPLNHHNRAFQQNRTPNNPHKRHADFWNSWLSLYPTHLFLFPLFHCPTQPSSLFQPNHHLFSTHAHTPCLRTHTHTHTLTNTHACTCSITGHSPYPSLLLFLTHLAPGRGSGHSCGTLRAPRRQGWLRTFARPHDEGGLVPIS